MEHQQQYHWCWPTDSQVNGVGWFLPFPCAKVIRKMQIWDYLLKKGRSWEKNDKGMATACQERKNLSRVSSQGTPHSSGRGSPFTVCTQSLEFSILNICHLLVKEMGWSKSLRTQLLKQLKGHKTRKRVIWSRQIWGHLGEAWVRCLKDVRPGSVPKG